VSRPRPKASWSSTCRLLPLCGVGWPGTPTPAGCFLWQGGQKTERTVQYWAPQFLSALNKRKQQESKSCAYALPPTGLDSHLRMQGARLLPRTRDPQAGAASPCPALWDWRTQIAGPHPSFPSFAFLTSSWGNLCNDQIRVSISTFSNTYLVLCVVKSFRSFCCWLFFEVYSTPSLSIVTLVCITTLELISPVSL
jgi:hypothetical protein